MKSSSREPLDPVAAPAAGAERSHPPRPRLTVRVGITGHRADKLDGLEATGRIARQLRLVLEAIEACARDVLAANRDLYVHQHPVLRLVSGFAEGADQIAVAACPPGWQIEAILPFPKQEYLRDFEASSVGDGRDVRETFEASLARADAVTQLDLPTADDGGGEVARRDLGYVAAGGYLLRQIDVLIAVWDGMPPKTGGTGAVARKAHEAGIPVVWIPIHDAAVPSLISAFEGSSPTTTGDDCTKGPLLTALEPIFDAPPASATAGRRSARARLERFLHERWHPRCYLSLYDCLKRMVSGRMPRLVIPSPSPTVRCAARDGFPRQAPKCGEPASAGDHGDLRRRVQDVLMARFAWADALAEHYSDNYRSAYVLAYLLSAVAVFVALGSPLGGDPGYSSQSKVMFAAVEMVVIVLIIVIIALGRWLLWHERWLDYRALAEALRHGRFLAFVSEFGRIHAPAAGSREPSWMLWYIRATMREIGLPTAVLDRTYQWKLLHATLENEVLGPEGQLAYHRANRRIMGRIDHLLYLLGLTCFGATFLLLALFLLGSLVGHYHGQVGGPGASSTATWLGAAAAYLEPRLIFWTAGLPALGAALAGIRAHGDFEGSQERSSRMVDALESLEQDYRTATERDIDLEETSRLLIATARVMSEDVAAWQELYGRKRLMLPE
jgi:hypothetical protein